MNPDLAMGDELLKKTGAGNLFMVFGEPDIDLQKQKDGKLVVEIRGVDVYDPTTGADPQPQHRRHRLLVHRHRLQRRKLLRPPRLLLRRRRAVREAEKGAAGRDRRGRMGEAVLDQEPALRPADERARSR